MVDMLGANAPIRKPHAVVPVGQMPGETAEHAVVTPGDDIDNSLVPPSIDKLRKMFDEARDLTDKARDEQEKDQDYYDGPGQANSEVRQTLKARGQPLVIDNRIAPAIDGILGVLEAGKTDPRAFPRNPGDQPAADVASKSLRFIADDCKWSKRRMDCAEDYLIHGITAAIVEWTGERIEATRIRWETFFYDPKSREDDFGDAKYLGVAKWMYADEITAMYPDRARVLGDLTTVGDSAIEATWDDRPEDRVMWVDKRRNRVLVVEIYYRDPRGWMRAVYCAAGWLEYGMSPYVDVRTGEPRCPIVAVSFKSDRHNNRYGPIRNMRYMQDEVNARRSRGLHVTNSRQVQNTDPNAPPVDVEEVRRQAARPDGVIPQGWATVQATDIATGNLAMLAEAKESLQRMVPVAIAQDLREGSASSGRARQVAQQAGLTQFGRGFGRFEDFEECVYRQFWMAAQQFWKDPKWVRVTDNPRAVEFIQVNEPIMGLVQEMQPVPGPDGQPVVDPVTGQAAMQATVSEGVVGYNNRPSEMDLDIIIAATPDTVALEFETFEAVMQLIQSGIDPMSPVFEIVLELAPLPDKTRILELIQAKREEAAQAAQAQAQAAQQAAELEAAGAAADIEKTAAETQGKQIDNELKVMQATGLVQTPMA
jgi:hypothetical protein